LGTVTTAFAWIVLLAITFGILIGVFLAIRQTRRYWRRGERGNAAVLVGVLGAIALLRVVFEAPP
jgi:hypothetical protein